MSGILTAMPGIVTASGPLDPDTLDWESRVISAGGTVSGTTLGLLNTYIVDQKTAGLWSKKTYLWIPLGDFVASRVPIIVGVGSSSVSLTNLVSGDYAETGSTGGYKGDGTNKYFGTGWSPTAASMSETNVALSSYWGGVESTGASRFAFGNGTATTSNLSGIGLNVSGTREGGFIGATSAEGAPATNSPSEGYFSVNSSGSRSQQFYQNGATVGAPVSSTQAFQNLEFYGLAVNIAGVATFFSSARYLRAIQCSTALTGGEQTSDYTIMNALQTSLGRNV